jgi:hypothetical protein
MGRVIFRDSNHVNHNMPVALPPAKSEYKQRLFRKTGAVLI